MDYQRIYDALIERSRERILEGYVEIHHIIPRCLGGSDEVDNLATLTAREHYIAHQLLVKLNPDSIGLVYAARLMTISKNRPGRINNRLYEWLKIRINVSASHVNKGRIHSQASKDKWSSMRKGRRAWNRGVPATEEANKKRSETQKERYAHQEHHLKGRTAHNKGKPSGKKGIPTGPKPKIVCEHCQQEIGGHANYTRWHGSNCKLNPLRSGPSSGSHGSNPS